MKAASACRSSPLARQDRAGRVSEYLGYFPDVLPTIAEVTGAEALPTLDGISLVPELLGEAAAGRKQAQHDYLYWEIGRLDGHPPGPLARRPPQSESAWELYDL